MDIKAILKARGLDDASIDNLLTNPAYAPILESFITEAEGGKTALLKAQEIEQNLKTWNETQVVPYVRGADEKVAKVQAELASTRAYLKTMKEQGYEVPDAMIGSEAAAITTARTEPTSTGIDSKYVDDRANDIARTNMALLTMSNKYRKYTGQELDLDSEYDDFGKNRRPNENMREYVARKYDISGLEAKARETAEQKKLDDYAAAKVAEEKTKWSVANGANPETRNPRSSRFDAIRQDENRGKLWQTAQGREQATKARLEKYSNLVN